MTTKNQKYLSLASFFLLSLLMLAGYQNCSKVGFDKGANLDSKAVECDGAKCSSQSLTIQLFNGYGDINNSETQIPWDPENYVSLCSYTNPMLLRPDSSLSQEAYFVLSTDRDTNNILCSRGPHEDDPSAWQCSERRALQGGTTPPAPPQGSNWVELVPNRKYVLSYTGIPYGDYKLRFKANSHGLVPEDTWQEVKFRVENCNTVTPAPSPSPSVCTGGAYETQQLCESATGTTCSARIQCVQAPCCSWVPDTRPTETCPTGSYASQPECESDTGLTCRSHFVCVRAPCCSWRPESPPPSCPANYYDSQEACQSATGNSCEEEFVCNRAPCCGWKSVTQDK